MNRRGFLVAELRIIGSVWIVGRWDLTTGAMNRIEMVCEDRETAKEQSDKLNRERVVKGESTILFDYIPYNFYSGKNPALKKKGNNRG